MSQKTIKGSKKLGESIRNRRQELGLTIEDAASKAGVGTKSWCRYESGESIRSDKAKGICKALNWHAFPNEYGEDENAFDIEYYKNHAAWSPYLCEQFGEAVAISFIIGSEIVLDHIKDDLNELSILPRGSHIGQLPVSMLKDSLPMQFLMRYDYEFLYELMATVVKLTTVASNKNGFVAHSVLDELAIYLFMEEASAFMECMSSEMESIGIDDLDELNDWAFNLFDDMDIVTFLYSNRFLAEDNIYHFDHWSDKQFYVRYNQDDNGEK